MAPSRGKGKDRIDISSESTSARHAKQTPRRSTRKTQHDDVPDVYREMLRDVGANDSSAANEASERPLKKRRVAKNVSLPNGKPSRNKRDSGQYFQVANGTVNFGTSPTAGLQTVEDSSESGEDDGKDDGEDEDTDIDFEDVDLAQSSASRPPPPPEREDEIADISVSVDPSTTHSRPIQNRRKPASAAEKAFRLLVHKAHVLCLLGHCIYINTWCNNAIVQQHLQPILSRDTISYLNPNTEDSQFQRNRSFTDGLQRASDAFRGQFRVTASGLRRAKWAAEGEENDVLRSETESVDRSDFITAAKDLEGSQDAGNQLFCALLRSVGVEARLICSLQPLPFATTPSKSNTPQKVTKPTIFAKVASDTDPNTSEDDPSIQTSSRIGKIPSVRRRLGQPSFAGQPSPAPPPQKKKPIRKFTYPIFWTEAFNTAHQKWIPIDPIVTQTVNKPSKFEPPSSYDMNQMMYVVAFEDSGVARDVTRRYAKAYNAKTRRQRVEASDNGAWWFKQALRIFRRRNMAAQDRDAIEDAELAAKEARESLPTNVQDFKDHPYYALERHLKRHEVIHPKREVGKVNAGTAAKPRMESVFRRRDVLACRSAEKWYRVGRVVREGEQGIKRVTARRRVALSPGGDEEDEEAKSTTVLYAPSQTDLYIPPPVVNGRIPRNAYGNLDIYTPSMVPPGGSHIRHALAAQAARILKVDYADAVTGFQFRGRHGTAVIEGAVVAEGYAEAVAAVVSGLEDERVLEESRERSAVALRGWKRFLVGLRIRERVSAYGDESAEVYGTVDMDGLEEEQQEVDEGGGFLPGDVQGEVVALPTAGLFSLGELSASTTTKRMVRKREVESDDEEEDGHVSNAESPTADAEDEHEPSRATKRARRMIVDEEDSEDEYMPDPLEDPSLLPDVDMEDGGEGGFFAEDVVSHGKGGSGFLPESYDLETTNEILGDERHGLDAEGNPRNGEDVDEAVGVGGGFILDKEIETGTESYLDPNAGDPLALVPRQEQPQIAEDAGDFSRRDANGDIVIGDLAPQEEEEITANGEDVPAQDRLPSTKNRDELLGQGSIPSASVAEASSVQEEHSDAGSMISHDPEDDDAEPDWLESD